MTGGLRRRAAIAALVGVALVVPAAARLIPGC
jgi:hypothetical protein